MEREGVRGESWIEGAMGEREMEIEDRKERGAPNCKDDSPVLQYYVVPVITQKVFFIQTL